MAGYIERITGLIPHTNKTVDIPLGGKSLIITGANGSGKTSLLRNAYEKTIVLIVNKKMGDLLLLRKRMSEVLSVLNDSSKIGTAVYDSAMRQRGQYQQALETLENGLQISIPQNAQFSSKYENRQAQVLYFQDMRLSEIAEAKYAQGLQNVIDENRRAGYDQNVGSKLEQHLVNLRTRRALAIAEDYDQALADAIENWFYQFEKNLKYLFQDDSLRLFFNSNKNKFSIELKDNPPFTFQTLSAGYRAVLDIYADLLMRTEYFSISPTALEGVVFIDEAEAHLHISLQRLILPFFVDSFPKIQFIVTTNSPYVLTSVRDILVFDLGK
ncbi:MAG: ATP-binding protein, partial [Treponema sp.]|nr:ATP-binding protein [Treponema sp.]